MNELEKICEKLQKSVLIVGFNEESKLVKNIKKNKNIDTVYTLTNHLGEKYKKNKKKKKLNAEKNIDIKKLKKELKGQTFDYIVCDFNTVNPFFRSFVKNSILIANKKVYLYVDGLDYEHDQILYRYERYGSKTFKSGSKEEYLFEIDVTSARVPFYKTFLYWFKDVSYDFVEFIANILIG